MAAIAAALLLTVLFVTYRSRTFHYCASTGDRPVARVAANGESCGPDEEPLEIERVGSLGRLKLAAQTVAKVFGGN